MTQKADFCGNQLRLSAFLRVTADGMPQRPTRFKRRFAGIEQSFDSQTRRDAEHSGAGGSPSQEAPHEGHPNYTVISDVVRSPWPRSPELATEHVRSATRASGGCQKNCKRSEAVQPGEDQHTTGERELTTAIFEPLDVSHKTSSTPRRRHLPVNELALLRTTSSDGLPLPSDATRFFATPTPALDPIEDNLTRSATVAGTSSGRSLRYSVKKPSPVKIIKPGSPAWLLDGRVARVPQAKSIGALSSMSVGRSATTISDGFVGVELDLQHSTRWKKQRASNRTRANESSRSHGQLVMACGYLPPTPIEHEQDGLARAEQRSNTASFHATGTTEYAGLVLPSPRRAVREICEGADEQEARLRRQSPLRQRDDLVRDRFSAATARNRHISESSNSQSVDGDTVPSRRFSSRLDESCEQGILQWTHTPLIGRVHSPLDAQRYFERAMRDLDAAGRSDSVSGEFWSQYGGLERNEEQWDTCGGVDLPHYV